MKNKIKLGGIILAFIICFSTFFISMFDIINWKQDSEKIQTQIKKIQEKTPIRENIKNENVEIIEQKEEIPETNPYWGYLNLSLINVDFYDLKEVNKDVAGWIQVNGTNINYPYVKTNDNKYYLTHSFDHSKNYAGWVFLDYRNNIDLTHKNNIIYAHGREDKTMFGTLKKIFTNGWLNNTDNHVIKISTENENTLWQVFSVYHIPATSDYLKINFKNDNDFVTFANMLLQRSMYNFNTTINETDKILTLSTCYNDYERVVLHAKLIKKETK